MRKEWQTQGQDGGRMEEYAKAFYLSTAWRKCRAGYLKKVGGLCERCLDRGLIVPAEVVHHRCYITPTNIHDPNITLNWDNLEALCWSCHEQEHKGKAKRYSVDAEGHIRPRTESVREIRREQVRNV